MNGTQLEVTSRRHEHDPGAPRRQIRAGRLREAGGSRAPILQSRSVWVGSSARRAARRLLAAKLFELARLSSGKAVELCGIGRVAFLHSLQRIGVTTSNLRPEDAADEVAFAARS